MNDILTSSNNDADTLASLAAIAPFVPAFLATIAVLILGLAGVHPLWPAVDLTLSEAAALKDRAMVVRLVEDGDNPDARRRVRAGVLKSYELEITPLEAAVGARQLDIVQLLVMRGARVEGQTGVILRCFAAQERAQDIVQFLATENGPEPSCETVKTPW